MSEKNSLQPSFSIQTSQTNSSEGVKFLSKKGIKKARVASQLSLSDETRNREHCHDSRNSYTVDKKAKNRFILVGALCLMFCIVELVVGIIAGSLALVSDAAYLLSLMVSLLTLILASKEATKKMTYGWHRAVTLGTLFSFLTLWVASLVIVVTAKDRIKTNNYQINVNVMVTMAWIGLFFNLFIMYILKTHRRSWFIIGNLIQSIGVVIVALIILVKPDWKIADPICTFVLFVIVTVTPWRDLIECFTTLLEGTPTGIDLIDVRNSLYGIPGVKDVHDLKIWSLSFNKISLTAHIAVDQTINQFQVLKLSSAMVKKKYGIAETTIQVEEYIVKKDLGTDYKELAPQQNDIYMTMTTRPVSNYRQVLLTRPEHLTGLMVFIGFGFCVALYMFVYIRLCNRPVDCGSCGS